MEDKGRLNAQQLQELSDELATLAQKQSDARETEVYIRMTPQEINAFDNRQERISQIYVILSNHDRAIVFDARQPSIIIRTMGDYNESKWYELYSRAMLELEHALMAGRIMDARSEILRRLEVLRDIPGLQAPERHAIQDALSGLRSLEREEVRYADEKHKEAAKLALEKLRSIGPAIKRMDPNPPDRG